MEQRRLKKLVTPFYLKMMRLNALADGADLRRALTRTGRSVTPEEVIELLGDHWRHRVMGAWFSVMHDDVDVAAAVLQALVTSRGSLDAPPLIAAAVTLQPDMALAAIETYISRDLDEGWGASGFATAAAEYLGATGLELAATTDDKTHFDLMMTVARQLRGNEPEHP